MLQKKSYSLAEQIYEQLENDILSGVIPKGEIITEAKISAQLGVSRTPIREALLRLEYEHMTEDGPKGYIVLGITDQDASMIYDIREEIEGMAASLAAKNITDDRLAEMKEIVSLQEYYLGQGDAEKIREQDNLFHELLYKAGGSPVLEDTLGALHKKVQKYRKLSVSNGNRAKDSVKEHKDIYDAIASHDPKAAAKAAKTHVSNARHSMGV